MFGVFGGGALAGALVYSAIGHRLPRRRTFRRCFTVVPLVYLALATTPSLPARARRARFAGLVAGPINPLLFTVTTEIVPEPAARTRLRRGSRRRLGGDSARDLLGGVLVGAIGVAATFLAIGVLLAVVVAYGFFNPAFREMDG